MNKNSNMLETLLADIKKTVVEAAKNLPVKAIAKTGAKAAGVSLAALVFSLYLTACPSPSGSGPEPDQPVSYRVTVNQPGSGGTISASPTSGPAGTSVTLSNSPAAGYGFSHYTVDGTRIDGGTFTLNAHVTVSGAFDNQSWQKAATPTASPAGGALSSGATVSLNCGTADAVIYYTIDGTEPGSASTRYTGPITVNPPVTIKAVAVKEGMNVSEVLTAEYTAAASGSDTISLGSGLTGSWNGAANTITINWNDSFNTAGFSINDAQLQGKNVQVVFDPASVPSGQKNISLAAVHYLRQAFLTGANAAAGVSITADTSKFTPVFDGRDWYTTENQEKNLYADYSSLTNGGEIEIMSGIKVKKRVDGKYVILNNRDLGVSRPVWQYNSNDETAPFYGFGLEKGSGNLNVPDNTVVLGGIQYEDINSTNNYPVVDDWTAYKTVLSNLGLLNGNALNHSHVKVTGVGTGGANVAANGMYDFVLAYYNPASTASGGYTGGRLPVWGPGLGLTFDGGAALPTGVTSRTIGGTASNSRSRKGSAQTSGSPASYVAQTGEPRSDFVNNLTVPMANYMKGTLGVSSFANTNIIGAGNKWENGNGVNVGGGSVNLMPTTNIGLIGNYDNLLLTANIKGVLDIKSSGTPLLIASNSISKRGYLNLWEDVLRETSIEGFYVGFVRGSNGEKVVGGDSSIIASIPNVIIYSHKYTNNLISAASANQPYYRAFVNSSGQVKLTDSSLGIDTKYVGSSNSQVIPSLDEAAWLSAGNSGLDKPAANLAANYAGLASTYKWSSAADFNSNAAAAAAPSRSPIQLAAGRRSIIEAILPSQFRREREAA